MLPTLREVPVRTQRGAVTTEISPHFAYKHNEVPEPIPGVIISLCRVSLTLLLVLKIAAGHKGQRVLASRQHKLWQCTSSYAQIIALHFEVKSEVQSVQFQN